MPLRVTFTKSERQLVVPISAAQLRPGSKGVTKNPSEYKPAVNSLAL